MSIKSVPASCLTGNSVQSLLHTSGHNFLSPGVRIITRLDLALAKFFTVVVHYLPETFQTPIICPLIITDFPLLQGFPYL